MKNPHAPRGLWGRLHNLVNLQIVALAILVLLIAVWLRNGVLTALAALCIATGWAWFPPPRRPYPGIATVLLTLQTWWKDRRTRGKIADPAGGLALVIVILWLMWLHMPGPALLTLFALISWCYEFFQRMELQYGQGAFCPLPPTDEDHTA